MRPEGAPGLVMGVMVCWERPDIKYRMYFSVYGNFPIGLSPYMAIFVYSNIRKGWCSYLVIFVHGNINIINITTYLIYGNIRIR